MTVRYTADMPGEKGTQFWCPSGPIHRHVATLASMTCLYCNTQVTADLYANAYRTRQYIIRELAEPW